MAGINRGGLITVLALHPCRIEKWVSVRYAGTAKGKGLTEAEAMPGFLLRHG